MNQVVAITFMIAASVAPTAAAAGERLFDGALGAASGAIVAGPPGLVAGGIIGYMAGPHISRSLGFHRRYPAHYGRRTYYGSACYSQPPYGHRVCNYA